ncbi:hypothetical protein, partial [Paracoccus sp. SSK6]|uniref:hypothetical protein n=1 Tax=Paracoccus sp. SSK6 TaxID=3143131 RepID=UPI00321A04EE
KVVEVSERCTGTTFLPVITLKATYGSSLTIDRYETVVAFSVYRRKNNYELPALTLNDNAVPAKELFIGNEGGRTT